jgi:hypothetical protein
LINVHRVSGLVNGFIEPIGFFNGCIKSISFFNGCIESINFFSDVDGSIASNSSINVKKRHIYILSLLLMGLFFGSFIFYINGISDGDLLMLFKLVNSFLNPCLFDS